MREKSKTLEQHSLNSRVGVRTNKEDKRMTKQVNLATGEVTETDTSKQMIYIDGFEEPMTIDEAKALFSKKARLSVIAKGDKG